VKNRVGSAHEGVIENLKVERAEAIAHTLRSAGMVRNVSDLASSNLELACTVDQWDQNMYLLGTPGGYVDLRTGNLQAATPSRSSQCGLPATTSPTSKARTKRSGAACCWCRSCK
jgi:phage/plasmid-associated DNA primase